MGTILSKFKQNLISELIDSVDSPVTSITINAGGSGYANGESLVFTGEGLPANGVIFTNNVGEITYAVVTNGGNYEIPPSVTITTANGFGASLTAVLTNQHFYLYAGRSKPFTVDTTPDPNYQDDYDSFFFQYDQMMFGKKVSNTDIAFMAQKYVWTANSVYTEYDDKDQTIVNEQFYVLTSTNEVFKCIYNNGGAPSTVEPSNTSSTGLPTTLSDGYRWKYMYSLSGQQRTKFETNSYIPVIEDANVKSGAIDGGIFNMKVETGGFNYPTLSGSILSINGNKIVVANSGSAQTNYYANCTLTVFGASNATTNRRIIQSYMEGTNNVIIVANTFNSNQISQGYSFQIAPTLYVTGDGIGFEGYLKMNQSSNSVVSVEVIDSGSGYNSADAKIISGTGFGSGASVRPIISPKGGHGSDVFGELFCQHVGITGEFSNAYGFPTGVTIRTVGILKNPKAYGSNSLYTNNEFDQTVTIAVANTSVQNFSNGEIVIGNVSQARGAVAFSNSSTLVITGYTGNLIIGEILTGQDSNVQFTVANVQTTADLKLYSGDVLYTQNITPTLRSNNSSQQIKLVVKL